MGRITPPPPLDGFQPPDEVAAQKHEPDRPQRPQIVLDLFGGSGSTLIACEKTGRHARLMELDPKYCDVIIKRWQDFTGKEAVLESSGDKFNDVYICGRKGDKADA